MKKNAKIRIANLAHSEFIQAALFNLGYHWFNEEVIFKHTSAKFLYVHKNGTITMGSDEVDFLNHKYTEAFTDEFLVFPKKSLVFILNDEYSAIVDYENEIVKVGCQYIPIRTVLSLVDFIRSNEPDI